MGEEINSHVLEMSATNDFRLLPSSLTAFEAYMLHYINGTDLGFLSSTIRKQKILSPKQMARLERINTKIINKINRPSTADDESELDTGVACVKRKLSSV